MVDQAAVCAPLPCRGLRIQIWPFILVIHLDNVALAVHMGLSLLSVTSPLSRLKFLSFGEMPFFQLLTQFLDEIG